MSTRTGQLSKKQLENIKAFRYQTCGLTPLETYIYNPFWEFIANYCLPDWLAPNALTLLGLVFPLSALITILYLDPSFSATLPCWVWLLSWFADFWYQTIDAIDGKQARRTDNCSPLGQILDHNLDQVTFTCMMIMSCSCLKIENDIIRILMITPGIHSAHYSIEFRTHFTHMHQTVIGFIGATEQLVLAMFPTLTCFFFENSNDIFATKVTVPGIEYETDAKDIAIVFAFITGVHYNLENIIVSFFKAEDKLYAIGCLLPYVQFFAMMYASSFSQLHKEFPAYFIILCGFYLTWVTAIYNLCSTAGAKFDWLFLEPFLFMAVVYCDHTGIFDRQRSAQFYLSFFAVTMFRYLQLMSNIVNQICEHMGLRFLKVKPLKTTKAE